MLVKLGALVLSSLSWAAIGGAVGFLSASTAVKVIARVKQYSHLYAGVMILWFTVPGGAILSLLVALGCEYKWGPTSLDALYYRVLVCGGFNVVMGLFMCGLMIYLGVGLPPYKKRESSKSK